MEKNYYVFFFLTQLSHRPAPGYAIKILYIFDWIRSDGHNSPILENTWILSNNTLVFYGLFVLIYICSPAALKYSFVEKFV